MLDFKKRNKSWRSIYQKIFIFILAVMVIFLGNASWNAYQKYKVAKGNRDNAAAELGKLYEREEKLKEDTDLLKTQEGIETLLRQRFNIAKEGEGVVVIVDKEDEEKTKQADLSKDTSFWGAFFSIFKRD